MFSNLSKGQQVFVIDKREDGVLKVGVVDEIKNQNPYSIGMAQALPFDAVVKYEDGSSETFMQIQPCTAVATYNNGNIMLCESRDVAQCEVEKINVQCKKHMELVPHVEKLLVSSEQMMRQLNPNYAKQQQTDEDIQFLKEGYNRMSGTLVEMKGMMEKMIAGISSSTKKSNS